MDLAALIQEFLVDCRARRLSPKTIGWYADNLRYFTDWLAAQGDPPTLAAFTLTNGRRYSHWLAERTAKQPTFVSTGGRVTKLIDPTEGLKAARSRRVAGSGCVTKLIDPTERVGFNITLERECCGR